MGARTEMYMRSMETMNDFHDMLYAALQIEFPGAEFSTTGCMWWRGYLIDAYKDLALRQYDCQVNLESPNVLTFKESYHNPKSKFRNPQDRKFRVLKGTYCYPFEVTLSLYQIRFFHYTVSEQFDALRKFAAYARDLAINWQASEARAKVTDPPFLHGFESTRHPRDSVTRFSQVSLEYLEAFRIQNELLNPLKNILVGSAPGNKVFPNKSWQNWDFRGYRQTLPQPKPGTPEKYFWEIYHRDPAHLVCFSYDGKRRTPLGAFNIVHCSYFDLGVEERKALLTEFVSAQYKAGAS